MWILKKILPNFNVIIRIVLFKSYILWLLFVLIQAVVNYALIMLSFKLSCVFVYFWSTLFLTYDKVISMSLIIISIQKNLQGVKKWLHVLSTRMKSYACLAS